MPKTRGESIFFTSITAWMMAYVMTLYNTVLATGTFTNLTFFIALKNMWIEYIIIGLLAYFVSGHLAKMCAFRVVQPGDRPIFIIFAIQTFTVIWQVAFASVISVFHGHVGRVVLIFLGLSLSLRYQRLPPPCLWNPFRLLSQNSLLYTPHNNLLTPLIPNP